MSNSRIEAGFLRLRIRFPLPKFFFFLKSNYEISAFVFEKRLKKNRHRAHAKKRRTNTNCSQWREKRQQQIRTPFRNWIFNENCVDIYNIRIMLLSKSMELLRKMVRSTQQKRSIANANNNKKMEPNMACDFVTWYVRWTTAILMHSRNENGSTGHWASLIGAKHLELT